MKFQYKILRTLYRELQYEILKNNPKITSEEEFNERLNKFANIKRKIAIQTIIFSFFGFFLASQLMYTDDESIISVILVTLAVVPFVFAIYQTTVQTSYIISLNIFKPLKNLPLDIGSYQLSAVLSIDLIPTLGIVLPSIVYLLIYYPVQGILAFSWFITGLLLGHAFGLLIYNSFGFKVEEGGKKLRFAKNILKILGFLAFMSMFFFITNLQEYFIAHSDVFFRYSIAYPFSLATVFSPMVNLVTLLVHLLIGIGIYSYSTKRVWNNLMGTKTVTRRKVTTDYRFSVVNPIISLMKKDLKIILRKTSMLIGFLFPLYILVPQVLMAIDDGDIPVRQTLLFLFMVGLLTVATTDAILKVDGKAIDALRNLPLTKGEFVLSKVLSMSSITIMMSFVFVGLGVYYHIESLLLIPYAFFLPLLASLSSMFYLFSYRGEEIGTPEMNFFKSIPLFILTGVLFLLVGIPTLVVMGLIGYLVSFAIAAGLIILLYSRLRS